MARRFSSRRQRRALARSGRKVARPKRRKGYIPTKVLIERLGKLGQIVARRTGGRVVGTSGRVYADYSKQRYSK